MSVVTTGPAFMGIVGVDSSADPSAAVDTGAVWISPPTVRVSVGTNGYADVVDVPDTTCCKLLGSYLTDSVLTIGGSCQRHISLEKYIFTTH